MLTVVLGLRGLGGGGVDDFAGGGKTAFLPSRDGDRNARGLGGGGGVARLAGPSV